MRVALRRLGIGFISTGTPRERIRLSCSKMSRRNFRRLVSSIILPV